jgi:ribosomal-protein-alanine N-acetyltransferase
MMFAHLEIRIMREADLTTVAALERRCHAFPWSLRLFREELANPLSVVDLLWRDTVLTGYLCSWQVCDELHILNVVIAPELRRRGLAGTLLRHVLQRARRAGCARTFLEVRDGNAGAIALYRAFGFRPTGRRRGYYADGEDALLLERKEEAPRGA